MSQLAKSLDPIPNPFSQTDMLQELVPLGTVHRGKEGEGMAFWARSSIRRIVFFFFVVVVLLRDTWKSHPRAPHATAGPEMLSSATESETGLDLNNEATESSDAATPLSMAWLMSFPSKNYETRIRSGHVDIVVVSDTDRGLAILTRTLFP